MIDYSKYLIDKLKEFVASDKDLSKIIPTNMNYDSKTQEYNIKKTYIPNDNEEDIYPLITVRTMQNNARSFNIINDESFTDVSWQIDIYAMAQMVGKQRYYAEDMCVLIFSKISDFIEHTLKFNRIVVTDPMPIDTTNQVYGSYLRYNAVHNLTNNKISRR